MDGASPFADRACEGTARLFDGTVQVVYVLLFGIFVWILCVILFDIQEEP